MARVTVVLPEHTEPAANRVRWEDLVSGLVDVSALRADAGDAHLVRLQIRGNSADSLNRIIFRVAQGPDGSDGSGGGPQLSDDWEEAGAAITIQVPGLADLVLAGPANPAADATDTTEPYGWVPGDDYDGGAISYTTSANAAAGLAQWVTDFKAAYAADAALRATLILDDGVAEAVDLAARATSGAPVVRGALSVATLSVDLAGRAAAGAPVVRGALEIGDLALDLAGRAAAGAPAVRAALEIGEPAVHLAGRVASDAPTVRGRLRIGLAVEYGRGRAAAAQAADPRAVLAHTGDRVLGGADSATQRLHDALLIARGSYPAARDYGSLLAATLDRSLNSPGVGELANAVADAIAHPSNGLDDVRLRSVSIDADDGVVTLDIQADWVSRGGTLTPIGLREQLAAG